MKLLKKSEAQKGASSSEEVSLPDRFRKAMAEAEAFIDLKTAELKASPDGELLPIGILRQIITKNIHCACAAALQIIEDEKKNNAPR